MPSALKEVYSTAFLEQLGALVHAADGEFDVRKFVRANLTADWDNLKLMERSDRVSESLHQQLPSDFRAAAKLLRHIGSQVTGLAGLCLPNYVAKYGLADWPVAMQTLAELTKYSSAEFAIRPFLIQYPAQTIAQMVAWSKDDSADVRRLASEGIRPRLPWGIRLKQFVADPQPILPILRNLVADDSQYVQKSVANNINDISKDHPQLMIDFCQEFAGQSDTIDWIIQRGLRTLFKAGEPQVLALLGYQADDAQLLSNIQFSVPETAAQIGETSVISYQLTATGDQPLALYLGYRMHYIRQNDQVNTKDFFVKRTVLQPGKTLTGQIKVKWRQLSTRKLYSGSHQIELLVNTQVVAQTKIELTV